MQQVGLHKETASQKLNFFPSKVSCINRGLDLSHAANVNNTSDFLSDCRQIVFLKCESIVPVEIFPVYCKYLLAFYNCVTIQLRISPCFKEMMIVQPHFSFVIIPVSFLPKRSHWDANNRAVPISGKEATVHNNGNKVGILDGVF